MSDQSQQDRTPEKTSPVEWAVAFLGAALVFGTIGYMIYYGISHPVTPPNVTVSQGSTSALPGGFLVEFTAENHGNSTAAGLLIRGSLHEGERIVEESEATLDYLPKQAQRKGGLIFYENPADYDLRLEARGFVAP